MTSVARHIKHNVVAYLALFVALGGTSYAAINLPRNSVGARQIRNHTIDPVKLNGSSTAGYVLDWAQISSGGQLVAARPSGARILGWNSVANSPGIGGSVTWPTHIPRQCFVLASPGGFPASGPGVPPSVSAEVVPGSKAHPFVQILESQPVAVNVAVVCPIP